MLWVAYWGFTASATSSVVFLAWMLGMPVMPAMSFAAEVGVVLATAPALALLVTEVRKYLH